LLSRCASLNSKDKIDFDILSEFGLTENQAKVFIATTRLGTPTVSEVAEASEVRREEVYRLLPELEKMGLVERLLGKPIRLRTPNPTVSISLLVNLEKERAQDRIADLSNRSQQLLQYLGHHAIEEHLDGESESDFSLIQEKESIRTGIYDMISKSTQQLDLLFSRADLVWILSTQGEVLQNAVKRGVKVRIISEPSTGRDRLPKIIHRRFPSEIEMPMKYLLNPTAFYIVADQSQLVLITSGAGHLPSSKCLWTNNESLVALTHRNFEDHWHESFHWKTVDGITLSVSPQDGIDGGTSHVHRLLLYQSPEVKYKVLFNFLKHRYDAGYMVLYICSGESVKEVKEAMYTFGFDSKLIDSNENLRILEWRNWLLEDGSFNIEKAVDMWDELYSEAEDHGFKGLAATTEMQFFFDNDMIEELEAYEKQVHDMIEGQMEIKCAYDEQAILHTKSPLQFYARLLGYHTTLLTEEQRSITRRT
jgi:sugar-specific transcriptional regulator TrmB